MSGLPPRKTYGFGGCPAGLPYRKFLDASRKMARAAEQRNEDKGGAPYCPACKQKALNKRVTYRHVTGCPNRQRHPTAAGECPVCASRNRGVVNNKVHLPTCPKSAKFKAEAVAFPFQVETSAFACFSSPRSVQRSRAGRFLVNRFWLFLADSGLVLTLSLSVFSADAADMGPGHAGQHRRSPRDVLPAACECPTPSVHLARYV
jgi:hypothetical protein